MSVIRDANLVREVGRELSNWGKWGADDERGTLNYITAECIREAARLVKKGLTFRLGLNFDADGPQIGQSWRSNPIHLMRYDGGDAAIGAMNFPGGWKLCDDMIIMPLQCSTHWDALAHVYYDDQLYNGFSFAEVSSGGANRNGIDKICQGVIGRGGLLDVARFKKKDMLEGGYGITPDELDACVRAQGVNIRPGDILCLRTGVIQKLLRDKDKESYGGNRPGLTFECVRWLHRNQIAAVVADNTGIEVLPNGFSDGCRIPFHMVALRDMGLLLGELLDLEALATDCDGDKVYDFLFVSPPLPITGATASPINPLAVK